MSEQIEFTIRKAKKSDLQNYLELSKEENLIEHLIMPELFPRKDYLAWFDKVLKSKEAILLAIINKSGDFIGQVYFKIEQNTASIIIGIKEDYRGMDLAAPIINESSKFLFSKIDQIESIIAYIEEVNIPSLKAFEQAGFLYYKNEMINDTKYFIYRYLRN